MSEVAGVLTARCRVARSLTWNEDIKTQMLIRLSLLSHGMRGTFHINRGNIGALRALSLLGRRIGHC
jgi:hypothetical protein